MQENLLMNTSREEKYARNARSASARNYRNTRISSSKISVIVPVYNSEGSLSTCIRSITEQSYDNLEIILVDDGSTDFSGDICDKAASRDSRIKVIHIKNGGPANARNVGIKNSTGEFIFFIDADDTIDKDALSILTEKKADLVIGNFKKIKNGEKEDRKDIPMFESCMMDKTYIINYARSYLKKPNKYLLFAFSWGRLFRADIIKKNNILFPWRLHTFEDVAFNFLYLEYVDSVYYLDETIYNHTVYDGYSSATMSAQDNPNKLFGFIEALDRAKDFLSYIPNIKEEIAHARISLTIIQLIRLCGQMDAGNEKKIKEFIAELVRDPLIRESLHHYSPDKGESKMIPFFIEMGFVTPIVWICKYKAKKRYK